MIRFILILLTFNLIIWAGAYWLLPLYPTLFFVGLALIAVSIVYLTLATKRKQERVHALLYDGLLSLQDNDFSVSLPNNIEPKYAHILALFNEIADKLRVERQSLYQRELMLDKVVNASNVVTLLVNHRETIVFANLAAKHLFNSADLIGQDLTTMLQDHGDFLLQHIDAEHAIVQKARENNETQSFHFSQHRLKLHGMHHRLYLVKPITEALYRQELQTWKRVIRVINHELNNSIAPISSMCHSGMMLAEKYQDPRLGKVFSTVSNRISKLSDFITSYSQLAKISTPQKQPLDLIKGLEALKHLYNFTLVSESSAVTFHADSSQLEQLFINLLKNAQEASQDNNPLTEIGVKEDSEKVYISIRDHGEGMPENVITQAFLPYFSTKENGSGVGLTICRDIVEVHKGQIQLANHHDGGLQVNISLPKL